MNPILSVGIYSFLVVLAAAVADNLLRAFLHRKGPGSGDGVLKTVHRVVYPILAVLALLPIAGAFLPDGSMKFALAAAGNIWLGFFIYIGGLLLVLGILFLIISALIRKRNGAVAGAILLVSLVGGVAVTAYGLVHARNTKVTHESVSLSDAEGGETYRIALLADLHLSVNSTTSMIQKMVDLTNAEEPDVILIAGDIFTSTYEGLRDPDAYAEILRGLSAPDGVYMVAGNHDVEETLFGGFPISPISEAFRTAEMNQFFADCGFTVLDDEVLTIAGGDIVLAGRLDGEKAGDGTTNRMSAAELLGGADTGKPVIVLEHEPKDFKALFEAGADLALCGHTHNGQFFPGNFFTQFFNSNPYGYRVVDGLQTIVTAGVGFYGPPMRVGTDSEVTMVEVTYSK